MLRNISIVCVSLLLLVLISSLAVAGGFRESSGIIGVGLLHNPNNINPDPSFNGETTYLESGFGLRNFNSDETISIDQIVIFNGMGDEVNFSLSPYFKTLLNPHQATGTRTSKLIGEVTTPGLNMYLMEIHWSTASGEKAIPLNVVAASGTLDEETGFFYSGTSIPVTNLE